MDGSNMADRGTTKSRMGLSGENEKHSKINNPRPISCKRHDMK